MAYFKELIALWTLVAVAAAQYTPYNQAYSSQYKAPYSAQYQEPYKNVELHKLCSWNVVEYDYPQLRDDKFGKLNMN